jgi:hypothetical protein
MGFRDDQIAEATVGGKSLAEATAKPKEHKYGQFRSKWEALYATELDYLKASGDILDWQYEAIRLKLTEARIVNGKARPGIWYTPDFAVWLPDGKLRFIEVKGYQRNASINRYKMAADKFPHFDWQMVTREGRHWKTIL